MPTIPVGPKSARACAICARAFPAATGARRTATAHIRANLSTRSPTPATSPCLIPEACGGSGLPLSAAAAILEKIQKSSGNGAACHAQIDTMGTLREHGSEEQRRADLPAIARGELRL